MLIDEHGNALLDLVHVRFSSSVYVKQTCEPVSAIDYSKCITLSQKKTTALLLRHAVKGVKGVGTWHKRDGYCTFAVIHSCCC